MEENKNKNNKKIIIAIIVAVIFICAVVLTLVMAGVIPSGNNDDKPGELITVTELVTDEQGEAVTDAQGEVVTETVEAEVVTQANGEVVTEVVTNPSKQPYTQKNGTSVTRAVTKKQTTTKKSTTKKSSKTTAKGETTTAKADEKPTDNNSTKPTEVVTQAPKPDKITNLKVKAVKKDSITITWDKLNCDKYEVQYSADGEKTIKAKGITATSYTIENLTSYTNYTIQVRGMNNSPGYPDGINGDWATTTQRTEPNNENRQITINYTLPVGSTTGEIEIYVKKDGDKNYPKKPDSTVKIDKSSGTITTKEKYKGLVTVMIKYNNRTIESDLTDKEEITLVITDINIGIANGEDD